MQCLYKFPPCTSGPLFWEGGGGWGGGYQESNTGGDLILGPFGETGSLWDLEGDCGLVESSQGGRGCA